MDNKVFFWLVQDCWDLINSVVGCGKMFLGLKCRVRVEGMGDTQNMGS